MTEDLISHQEQFFHLRSWGFQLEINFWGGVTHVHSKVIASLVPMLYSNLAGRSTLFALTWLVVGKVEDPVRG